MKYAPSASGAAIMAAVALSAIHPVQTPARAEVISAQSHDLAPQVAELATGDQLIVAARDETVPFAGHMVVLENFSGVVGYASELAYLVVIDGSAEIGDQTASRGRMILVPPFGGDMQIVRFDAERLYSALADASGVPSAALASLESLATAQDRGVFWGRLARTDFNVATLGSAGQELKRRELVGGEAIRDARFVAPEAAADVEGEIVRKFLARMAAGDADAAAQFLDPMPFGYSNMDDGGSAARRVMAAALVGQHDWQGMAGGSVTQAGDTEWLIRSERIQARITLRRTTDFAFIQSIDVENL